MVEEQCGDSSAPPRRLLRRVRAPRDTISLTDHDTDFVETPDRSTTPVESELEALRELLAERDRQLAEWQTCHDSVERELKRASLRASALQSKINATSNELAQARTELAKARGDADANRKANEALNRQLQVILKTNQNSPPTVAASAKPASKRKSSHKALGELAA
jgi:septal ring factor EnvC (AmiA/AmiB activator)